MRDAHYYRQIRGHQIRPNDILHRPTQNHLPQPQRRQGIHKK